MLICPSCQSVSAVQEDLCPLIDPEFVWHKSFHTSRIKGTEMGVLSKRSEKILGWIWGGVKVKHYYLIIKLFIKNLYMS
jgi:hypothetical protein